MPFDGNYPHSFNYLSLRVQWCNVQWTRMWLPCNFFVCVSTSTAHVKNKIRGNEKVKIEIQGSRVLRDEPLIIVGGGVGHNREKKGSGADGKKKKKASALLSRKKKQVPLSRGKKSKCKIRAPHPPQWLMVRPLWDTPPVGMLIWQRYQVILYILKAVIHQLCLKGGTGK